MHVANKLPIILQKMTETSRLLGKEETLGEKSFSVPTSISTQNHFYLVTSNPTSPDTLVSYLMSSNLDSGLVGSALPDPTPIGAALKPRQLDNRTKCAPLKAPVRKR